MSDFLKLCYALIGGCAQFFDITVPGLDITFFELFAAVLIICCVLAGIRIIFGTDHGGDRV